MMLCLRVAVLLMLGWGLSQAGTASQADWASGPYTQGPVREWSDEFASFLDLDYYSQPGVLTLSLGSREVTVDDFNSGYCVHVADVDGDGDDDILGSGISGDIELAWWENLDGSGTAWQKHVIGSQAGTYSLDAVDLNGDGELDLLTVSASMDRISWWENPGGGIGSWTYHYISYGYVPGEARGADLDGDGDADAAVAITYGDEVAWWENLDGAGTDWTKHTLSATANQPRCICLTDIDGDGDIDVAATGPIAWLSWWENPQIGEGDWIEHQTQSGVAGPDALEDADFDGDGDTDLIAVGSNGKLAWWENLDGAGTSWSQVFIETDLHFPETLGVGDLDGDGDTDFSSNGKVDYELGWWENHSGASSWEYHAIERYYAARQVHCGDIDGDGRPEIAGVYCYRDLLSWFDVIDGYAEEGGLVSSILYLGHDPEWGDIDWTGEEPVGTSIAFLVRASDDGGDLGAWSDTIWTPGSLQGVLDNGDSYLQYHVLMSSEETASSPSLDSVTFTWLSVGLEEACAPLEDRTLRIRISPDPVRGDAFAMITLPTDGMLTLTVFDLAGRAIDTTSPTFGEPGEFLVLLGEYSSGLYFCRLRLGDMEAWDRFVVIR